MAHQSKSLIPPERIERSILFLRNERVILDIDLAELYEVPTKALVQAVKRNIDRFPADFMLQMTKVEFENWRSQFVTSNSAVKQGLRWRPYVFTEQGVAMLSSVLRSERAVQVNVAIMRTFVRLRELIATNKDLVQRLDELEKRYDSQFRAIFELIQEMISPPEYPRTPMGFIIEED
jgi:hypothetical protein